MTSLSDTPRLQYYDVQTLEYRYISKLPMKNERIWSYVKETTSHLQNKLTKNIHLGVVTTTFISRIFLLDIGTVLTVWYFLFSVLFLGFFYYIYELFRQCGIFYFSFHFYDFSIRFRNCSDSVVFYIIPFISTIFLLDLGTVLTVWYFLFFLLFLGFFC